MDVFDKSSLDMLKNTYYMYEKNLTEGMKIRKEKKNRYGDPSYSEADNEKTLELLKSAQNDIRERYLALGGTMEELMKKPEETKVKRAERRRVLQSLIKQADERDEAGEVRIDEKPKEPTFTRKEKTVAYVPQVKNILDGKIPYDMIPLPSNGECYRQKLSSVPVAYMTGKDENLMVQPNLFRDGTFIDILIRNKLMTDEISAEELLPGDRDAIALWLRSGSYGPEYAVTATDDRTGEDFDAVVDLSALKYKPFRLKGDENGYFDFELPVSKDKIKFKFLTYADLVKLKEKEENQENRKKRLKIRELTAALVECVNNDDGIDRASKMKVKTAVQTINEYSDTFEDDENVENTTITDRMAASIVSVNGVTDRNYINDYVLYMNVKDAVSLRTYIVENEPGVDYNIELERPESLGGGSMKTFLQLNQFIFFNIS